MLLFLFFALLLLYRTFTQIGIPVSVIQLLICLLGVILNANHKHIAREKKIVVTLLFVLSFIDKVNDLSADFDVVAGVGPILYTLVVTSFFSTFNKEESRNVIKLLYYLSILSFVISIVPLILSSEVLLRTVDRTYSILLYLFWILNTWYGKKKVFVSIVVFFVNIFIFEARTMIISMSFFLFCYYFLANFSKKIRRWLLIGIFASGILFVMAGIIIEFVAGVGNTEFSNHGLIWGVVADQMINSKSLYHFLFGYPTTPETLSNVFSSISLIYGNNGYITNVEDVLEQGHFHCSLVYYLYNTGVVGLSLLFYTIYKAMKAKQYNVESFTLFGSIFYVAIFNGQNLTGVYLISTIFLLSLLFDFPEKNSYKI